ncbi:MAG: nucleoside triphosphate pyrophosphatase [Actinomycetaceae bacterium]|nr:nucleoside triphosphate pyrophosphatase [Actinomycetaceae bacterium]MDU0969732.1 nucleoside triphosphate pyrophosphatase [Actinomycetaceae bacterium]
MTRLILASASPARLSTLRAAGLTPEVVVAGIDEDACRERNGELLDPLPPLEYAEATTTLLATEKARAVAKRLRDAGDVDDVLIIGCDSMLLFNGELAGKPHTPEVARERWRTMRGNEGDLVTGHTLIHLAGENSEERSGAVTTRLTFAQLSDAEIDAYVATGEPLEVAGGFTLDALGGPFVTRIEGDYHSVIGLSLPLARQLAADMGVFWPSLWASQAR